MIGRTSKFTPARTKKIIQGLKSGMTRIAACGYAGISDETLRQWCLKDVGLLAQVEEAERTAEANYSKVIERAAKKGDWQAAKYWLSRRRRKDWGDSLHVDLDEEIKQLLAQIAGVEASDADRTTSD